ncbi:MAG TPA: tetratricopeptide repeat protein [Terriglobales bacterium]|nr:tetratricopeptide repeat protein [Terriglobales bacterium]
MKRNLPAAGLMALMALLGPSRCLSQCQPTGPAPVSPSDASNAASQAPQFYDEPRFTVAGVTDATNLGGHGSDVVVRTKETLAKDTASLGKQTSSNQVEAKAGTDESTLRAAVERDSGNAELHHRLAGVEENLKHSLEAVREYQRAAELNPSESYLFDWGTELLAHRAPEAALEVFAKGNRLFPDSARMLVGLGVAWHARGAYDQAADCLLKASDLNPSDPMPYVFLAKLQNVEAIPSDAVVEKLARFVRIHPDNALANYYYASSLWKRAQGVAEAAPRAQVLSLLEKAVHLDPTLSHAYLLRGIVDSDAGDLPKSILSFRSAIDANPLLEEPHYRLALAYRRVGEKGKAQHELQLYKDLSKKSAAEAERERLEIPQFVIALRDKKSPTDQPQKP